VSDLIRSLFLLKIKITNLFLALLALRVHILQLTLTQNKGHNSIINYKNLNSLNLRFLSFF